MDFIKTKNDGGLMDVIFDGRFIFIDKWHGLVAIAQPVHNDSYNLIGYHIERTQAISVCVIRRVINNYMNDMYNRINPDRGRQTFTFKDCTVHPFVGSLPYGIELNITK